MNSEFNMRKYLWMRDRSIRDSFKLDIETRQIEFPLEYLKEKTREKTMAEFVIAINHQVDDDLAKIICDAPKDQFQYPRTLTEYSILLQNIHDEAIYFIEYITPIVKGSLNNNIMKTLFIILNDTTKVILKLIEIESVTVELTEFEYWCNKLIDNSSSCMRVLLACCLIQNSYATANEILFLFSVFVMHLDTLAAFLSIEMLHNLGCVLEPSRPVIFQRIYCQKCKRCVSFSGCYCINCTVPLKPDNAWQITMDLLEDAPTTSQFQYTTSWDRTLLELLSLPIHKRMSTFKMMEYIQVNEKFQSMPQRPLIIRDCDDLRSQLEDISLSRNDSIETLLDAGVERTSDETVIDDVDLMDTVLDVDVERKSDETVIDYVDHMDTVLEVRRKRKSDEAVRDDVDQMNTKMSKFLDS